MKSCDCEKQKKSKINDFFKDYVLLNEHLPVEKIF
jgi:hypothetical protein